MGTKVGAAMDYLVTTVTELPECAAPVVVSDGYTSRRSDTIVWLGVTNEDGSSEVDVEWAGLGASREDESFDIPCLVEAYRGGGDEAVKPARDAAVTILDAINAAVRADRSLGGALTTGAAALRAIRLVQTADPEEAGDGRYARIYFAVRCTNRF